MPEISKVPECGQSIVTCGPIEALSFSVRIQGLTFPKLLSIHVGVSRSRRFRNFKTPRCYRDSLQISYSRDISKRAAYYYIFIVMPRKLRVPRIYFPRIKGTFAKCRVPAIPTSNIYDSTLKFIRKQVCGEHKPVFDRFYSCVRRAITTYDALYHLRHLMTLQRALSMFVPYEE